MSSVRWTYVLSAVLLALGLSLGFAPDALAQVVPDPNPVGDALSNGLREASEAPVALDVSIVQLFLLVTVLSLAPGIAMMVTCLPLIIIVLSFLRQALGLQQTPPNSMIMGLGLILTFFIMEPVLCRKLGARACSPTWTAFWTRQWRSIWPSGRSANS